MTTDRWAEERIRSWLFAAAPDRVPGDLLTATFDQTRQLPQRSRKRRWATVTLRPLPIVAAAAALVVVLVAVSVRFGAVGPGSPDAPRGQPLGVQFGQTAQIGGVWASDSESVVAFTVQRDPGDGEAHYWRAVTYDQVDMTSWRSSAGTTVERSRGERILDGMADDVDQVGHRSLAFTIEPDSYRASTLLSPATPISVDRDVTLNAIGEHGYLASLGADAAGAYTVTALVPEPGGGAGMLNESALRAAGTDYPAEVVALYTTLPAAVVGPNVARLRDDVVRSANSAAPYDIAKRLVDVLHGTDYVYDTDVRDLDCAQLSTAECFATYRRGYCQYYATTMAVILRDLGIPTRLVGGFLPGQRRPGSGVEVVPISAAHTWVEVYFPGYEWVPFDPTGGRVARLQALPS